MLNQPGAGGALRIRASGSDPPDGATLYIALASNVVALPEMQASLPFDVARDFVPIGYIGEHPMVIAGSPTLGVSTLPELIALAKKRKGELNIAAGNRGSILHFSAEWLRSASGIDVTLVHYPGAPQALTDVLGGRVHAMVDALSGLAGTISGGSIKALAVASEQRLPTHRGLPTVAETLPGFMAMGWFALMAPPKTLDYRAQGQRRPAHDPERGELKQRFLIWEHLRPMPGGTRASPLTSSDPGPVIAEIMARSSNDICDG